MYMYKILEREWEERGFFVGGKSDEGKKSKKEQDHGKKEKRKKDSVVSVIHLIHGFWNTPTYR
jgi:hypothetical protein